MPLVYVCPECREEMIVSRRHRGTDVPCPGCRESVSVPKNLAFDSLTRDAVADRRAGYRLLLVAAAACVLWFPIIPATAWFWAVVRIRRTRDEGRTVPEPLFMARTVAATAFCAQMAYYIALINHLETYMDPGVFSSW